MMPGLNTHLESVEFGDAVNDWIEDYGLAHYINQLRDGNLLDKSFYDWSNDDDLTTDAYIENEGR